MSFNNALATFEFNNPRIPFIYSTLLMNMLVPAFSNNSFSHNFLKEGVPEEVILREDGATFTYQNAINSRKVTDAVGIRVKKAIICCKAQHARRCKLYYQYLYPQTTFLICPSDVGINRENWFDTQKGRKEVLGEVEKCGEQLQRIFCREADSWSI